MTLLFDLDNTLIDRDTAYFKWLKYFFNSLQLRLSIEEWAKIKEKDNHGYTPRNHFFEWLIAEYKLEMRSNKLADKSYNEIHKFLPKVTIKEATLIKELSNKHQLGIVTNGGVENQMNKLRSSNWLSLFEKKTVFISGELGFSKPHELFFTEVEKRLNKKPEEIMIIGDDFQKDILGGYKAGWKTVWVSSEISKKNEVNFTINHWTEIKNIPYLI